MIVPTIKRLSLKRLVAARVARRARRDALAATVAKASRRILDKPQPFYGTLVDNGRPRDD